MKKRLAVILSQFSSCSQGLKFHALQQRISTFPGSVGSATEGRADPCGSFLQRTLSLALIALVLFPVVGCLNATYARNKAWKKQFTYLQMVQKEVTIGAKPPITCPTGSATNPSLDWYQQATCYLRDTTVDQATRMAVRNAILENFVTLINHIYGDFEHDIVADRATLDTGFDAANLGLTAASSATGLSVLATVATGTLGLQHAIATNYYQGQTQLVINAKMQQLRLQQLVLIRQHETLPVTCPAPPAGSPGQAVSPTGGAQGQCYSLQQGMNEVQDLFYAGTVHRALQEISNQTGAQTADAQKQLKSLTTQATAAGQLSLEGLARATAAASQQTVTVTAQDQTGNTASGFVGTVHFTSTDTNATLPGDYTFMAGDAGVHRFAVVFRSAGMQSLTVSSNAISATTSTNVQLASPPTQFSLQGLTGPIAAASQQTVTVTAQDQAGNTAVGFIGTVHFTSTDNNATLPADYTFVAGDAGVHRFTVVFRSAGSQSLTVSSRNMTPTTASMTVQ